MNNENTTANHFTLRDASWLTIALAGLTVLTFLAVADHTGPYSVMPAMSVGDYSMNNSGPGALPTSGAESSPSMAPAPDMQGRDLSYPYPYPHPEVPATDTREFLKIYYNAVLRTRDVPALTRRVETVVRGYDGRIDQQSSSDQYGSVSFALPQSKYEAFRTELESLVDSRFLTVNISSQNMLTQKVSIEEQQAAADTNLVATQTSRQKIVAAHISIVKALQSKITTATSTELASLTQQLANENARYTKELSNADANVTYAQKWQKAVQTQDKQLLENIATVTGTVSISWMSLWQMLQLYLPGYLIPGIFAVLTLISLFYDRRRAETVSVLLA